LSYMTQHRDSAMKYSVSETLTFMSVASWSNLWSIMEVDFHTSFL
jgi:hypothetical protein